jgi:hypothetical protein
MRPKLPKFIEDNPPLPLLKKSYNIVQDLMPNNGVNYAFLKLTKFKLNNQGKSEIATEIDD